MHAFTKRAIALVLSLLMVLGAAPAFAASAADAAEVTLPSVTTGDSILRAAFTNDTMKINGLTTEYGWSMTTKVGENATAGAQWDHENLYLAVRTDNKEKVTLTVNGIELNGDNAKSKISSNKMNVEYQVSLETLSVTVDGYGTKIPVKVQVGNAVWEGDILLTAIDWFAADNSNRTSSSIGSGRSGMRLVHAYSQPTPYQNSSPIKGGYNLYDVYNADSRVAISIRTYVTLGGANFAPLGDRTADTLVEFDFHAKAMPEYELGTDNDFWAEYTTCGFNWYITDSSDHYVTMGIINTDSGLMFVLQNTSKYEKDTGPMYSCPLNKQVGDTFRIGTNWTTEGDIILYVDGEILDVIKNAESTHTRISADNVICYQILRNTENATSAADDINVEVTNLAAGKYYGENMLDSLHFDALTKNSVEHFSSHAVTGNLTLPTTLSNPIFKDSAISWSSSDSSVIDPKTGNVTRPAENGTMVTLTATETASGATKSFNIYVPGMAPVSNVLTVQQDITPEKSTGKVADVPEFALDSSNNSVIRDLGEAKTVNVIVLKDSDDINKLNETMLTIWASDDNKEYTQIPAFKMLRDGMYTYLYDFEATGRYIKVHCTDCGVNDAEFIAPLDRMIEARFENVFGDGGAAFSTESTVTITNEADSAKFDYIAKISPADAGVQCAAANNADVRFYLDGEMLYHYFDGTDFYVRVTKIPKNGSVTLDILSGNASAKDISNKANVYEIVYGTVETSYSVGASRYMLTLPNGTMMAFRSGGENNATFSYRLSTDKGRSWSNAITAVGSFDYLCVPQGSIYDEAAGRIIVTGWRRENGVLLTRYMYSDDMGRSWKKAPLTQTGEYESSYLLSYSNIARLSCNDGDGPNVDYVHALYTSSPAMEKYYNNGYSQGVTRVAYSTDNGLTWTLSPDDIGYYEGEASGEHAHTREHGNCEHCILEAKDGTVVVYMRCQYDNVFKLSRSVSKDHGKTWQTHAELSDVYSVNCQPMLFDHADNQFLLWPGNNMYGQASFRRCPLSIGVSYDNLMTFVNTIDIYSKTAMQGLMMGSAMDNTNPQIAIIDDTLIAASSQQIRIENFTDYFFRTRGAYDTFENTTPEYEGWATTGGEIRLSDAQASEGKYSMRIATGSSAARSIPYLQNGTVAFDLYIENVDKAKFDFEFESAYGFEYGLAAPIAFRLDGNKATFLGADSAVSLDLTNGWNRFEFNLDLLNDVPAATLSVNGGAAIDVPVDAEIGNYVCYVHVRALGTLEYFLDDFLVNDMDNAYAPDVIVSAEAAALTAVPENLSETYADAAGLTAAMQAMIITDADSQYTAENTAVYALSPIISKDGGDTWAQTDVSAIPTKGMTVKIAYPEGTAADTHAFRAADANGVLLTVTEGEDGLYVKVSGTAPVILGWIEFVDPTPDVPGADGGISPVVWIGGGAVIAVVIAASLILAKKGAKKNA